MDPLTALSLAAAVTQFVDFAGKLISGTRQAYNSGTGITAGDADLELCASELDQLCTRLTPTTLTAQTEDDKALVTLAKRCNDLSAELSTLLRKIRAKDPDSKWSCFVSSLKTQLKKSKRDELAGRLAVCRSQLEVQLVRLTSLENQALKEQVQQAAQANDDSFTSLRDWILKLRDNVTITYFSPKAANQLQELFALPENTRRTLTAGRILNLLYFDDMYDRLDDIVTPQERTLEWVLNEDAVVVSASTSGRSFSPPARSPMDMSRRRLSSVQPLSAIEEASTPPSSLLTLQLRNDWPRPPSAHTTELGAPDAVHTQPNDLTGWLRGGSGIYHVSGRPSSGKSTFTKHLAMQQKTASLLEQWAAGSHHVLGKCFLHRRGSKLQKSMVGLCRTILHDILRQAPELTESAFPDLWRTLHNSHYSYAPSTHLSIEELRSALLRLFQRPSTTISYMFSIFIDGLDEQDEENLELNHMIDLMSSWLNVSNGKVKLLVTTQEDRAVSAALNAQNSLHLHDLTTDDVLCFVRSQIHHSLEETLNQSNLPLSSSSVNEDTIVAAISQRANGDYRWAMHACKALLRVLSGEHPSEWSIASGRSPPKARLPTSRTETDVVLDTVLYQEDVALLPNLDSAWGERRSSSLASGTLSIDEPTLYSASAEADTMRQQIKDVEARLGDSQTFLDDLSAVQDARLDGTCTWFVNKPSFLTWTSPQDKGPRLLWAQGAPASGKSTLAGYVIDVLQAGGHNVSYFFFKHSDRSKTTLSACFRALALQMAQQDSKIRQRLIALLQDDNSLDTENENDRLMWRKLFSDTILPNIRGRQYWVIDALDECEDLTAAFTTIFGKLDRSLPLHILVTSRDLSVLQAEFPALSAQMLFDTERLSSTDTIEDITLLVEAKVKALPAVNPGSIRSLTEDIVTNAQGSFLWTVLVLQELSQAYSDQDFRAILAEMPKGMGSLYARTIKSMSLKLHERGKRLAKAILTWVICATRPLTVQELDGALRLQLKETFANIESSIKAVCGQLVYVDKTQHVQMVHKTAREYLQRADLVSEFAVVAEQAHTTITQTSLAYLISDDMKPPRSTRRGGTTTAAKVRAPFSAYACASFSFHLTKAGSQSGALFDSLHTFLSSNVLSWLEIMAKGKSLNPITQSSNNIRKYLANINESDTMPPEAPLDMVERWTTDLVRLCAKFAHAISVSPAAIYTIVPAFCPAKSAVYQAAKHEASFSVIGSKFMEWDDRLSCIDFDAETRSVAIGSDYFAVGLASGNIVLHHSLTGQEYKTLAQKEPVHILCFLGDSGLLASYGSRDVVVWNIAKGEAIHRLKMERSCIALAYDSGTLIAACSKNFLRTWDITDNAKCMPDKPWDTGTESNDQRVRRQPSALSIAIQHKILAFTTVGLPIILWDLATDEFISSCGKILPDGETSRYLVTGLVINPNPSMELIATTYLDGELLVIDMFSNETLASRRANCPKLYASADGNLLAGPSGAGIIDVYQFETLDLVYRVRSSNLQIKHIVFSPENLRFLDIRGKRCNVWSAAALRQKAIAHRESQLDTDAQVVEISMVDTQVKITSIVLQTDDVSAICGESDGSIKLYNLKTAELQQTLYRHRAVVRELAWWPSLGAVVSIDAANSIIAYKTTSAQSQRAEQLFQARINSTKAVTQLLLGQAVGKFIVSTRDSDHLWSIQGREEHCIRHEGNPTVRRWLQHPASKAHVLCIGDTGIQVYAWEDWSLIATLPLTMPNEMQLKRVLVCTLSRKPIMVLELVEIDGGATTRGTLLVGVSTLPTGSGASGASQSNSVPALTSPPVSHDTASAIIPTRVEPIIKHVQLAAVTRRIAHIIGMSPAGRLVFFDRHSWVCSFALEQASSTEMKFFRHFFVPYDWFSGNKDILAAVSKRNIILTRHDKVVVVKGGLDFAEEVTVSLSTAFT